MLRTEFSFNLTPFSVRGASVLTSESCIIILELVMCIFILFRLGTPRREGGVRIE